MKLTPLEIKRKDGFGLLILWSDQSHQEIPSEVLRLNCPCAHCREARGDNSHQKPLTAKRTSLKIVESSKDEELLLKEIWTVGNYALGIRWGDGHDTGIYTYEQLRGLGG